MRRTAKGDQRNHHAHILTTTRVLCADGLTDKTRILDAAKTGGAEIDDMRGLWAQMQNHALERAGQEARVDHRSLEDQREAALERGEELVAMTLDRDAEIKLGPAANAMERRALKEAERDGTEYAPVTERGAQVHGARQQRSLMADLLARMVHARDALHAGKGGRCQPVVSRQPRRPERCFRGPVPGTLPTASAARIRTGRQRNSGRWRPRGRRRGKRRPRGRARGVRRADRAGVAGQSRD